MIVLRFIKYFAIRGFIASLVFSLIGIIYAVANHHPITNVTISTANLLGFFVLLALGAMAGNSASTARTQHVSKAILTTSRYSALEDYPEIEDSFSFAMKVCLMSIVPLGVWAIAYYVF